MNRRTDEFLPWVTARVWVLALALFWLCVLYGVSRAATNLPQICTKPVTANACGAARSFNVPTPETPVTMQAGASYQWALLKDVPDTASLAVCAQDIAAGTLCPVPNTYLPKCEIVVCAPPQKASGTFPLSWTAPTKNTDGSPLTDLAGYRLYSGVAGGTLTLLREIKLTDASPTRVQLSGYGNGVYDFAVTAFTSSARRESVRSPVKTVTVSITSVPASPSWD